MIYKIINLHVPYVFSIPCKETILVSPVLGVDRFIEEIRKGNYQVVLDHLRAGGSLSDFLYDKSLACLCLIHLNPSQIKDILSSVPENTELPWDVFLWAEEETAIQCVEELLPDLEKFNYPFDKVYQNALENGRLEWIAFFLSHAIHGLDLNHSVFNFDIEKQVHPCTQMRIWVGQNFLSWKIVEHLTEDKRKALEEFAEVKNLEEEISLFYAQICETLRQMENHPGIHLDLAQKEMEKLRAKGYYFPGDSDWERDCLFFAEAATFEGLEKHIAQGFNLYEPIGPFFMYVGGSANKKNTWIDLMSWLFFGYERSALIALMEKYHPQL